MAGTPQHQPPAGGATRGDDAPDGPTRSRRARSGWRRWLPVAVAVLALLAAAGGGWLWHLDRQLDSVQRIDLDLDERAEREVVTAAGEDPPPEAVTILVAGVDSAAGPSIAESMDEGTWEAGRHRTDTMMVVRVSADRKRAHVVSLPRDSWVRIPGHGRDKLNAAFALGGPPLFLETVERLTGAQVDHLVIVDWEAFKQLTTAIGGVPVYIPEDVEDPSQGVSWEQGRHVLEGREALQYVRQRHGLDDGDFDRIERQQNFLRATVRKMLSDGTMSNPVRLTSVLEAVTEHLTVDDSLTDERLRELAMSLRGLRARDLGFLTAPTNGLDRVRGQSIVRLDVGATRELFQALQDGRIDAFLAQSEVDRLPDPESVE